VTTLLAACGGFLLAVLWMDLMFDVQVWRARDGGPAARDAAVSSIATYYRRVTTDAFPLNRLIGIVMVVAVAGSVRQALGATAGRGRALLALALCGLPIALAALRVVPAAVRLGARRDAIAVQHDLARAILRDHVLCFIAIATFTAIELSW